MDEIEECEWGNARKEDVPDVLSKVTMNKGDTRSRIVEDRYENDSEIRDVMAGMYASNASEDASLMNGDTIDKKEPYRLSWEAVMAAQMTVTVRKGKLQ